jgi:hypothetical protein
MNARVVGLDEKLATDVHGYLFEVLSLCFIRVNPRKSVAQNLTLCSQKFNAFISLVSVASV